MFKLFYFTTSINISVSALWNTAVYLIFIFTTSHFAVIRKNLFIIFFLQCIHISITTHLYMVRGGKMDGVCVIIFLMIKVHAKTLIHQPHDKIMHLCYTIFLYFILHYLSVISTLFSMASI